jgi:V/A-type H+/Na+-transporting ATPase subunit A
VSVVGRSHAGGAASTIVGAIERISGPIARVRLTAPVGVLERVHVGIERLAGEVVSVDHDRATVQVFEGTTGVRPGEVVEGTGRPLSVRLGPGALGAIVDGIQRPLDELFALHGHELRRGATPEAPPRRWSFTPCVREGDRVAPGTPLGVVPETAALAYHVLVPPDVGGVVDWIAPEGTIGDDELVARLVDERGRRVDVPLVQQWPVRRARPFRERLSPDRPMVTGQRVLDTFFPVARGGAAALPGPFGAGKTVLQHSLAKWCDADVIVYVGCGERGNEMAQVLEELPGLVDPRTGRPLLERTVLVANTSNMPVAAREASVYTGVTLAESFRDQGYHVALMADSTSRWAEALREIAGRLEEMPAEEGFPAYLPSRLAAFYERSGRVTTLSGREGSVTIIGAVSPPGGDMTEPVTQHTLRFTRALWSLDRDLAAARHYPAVSWRSSYSFDAAAVAPWWRSTTGHDWLDLRQRAADVLEEEARLEPMVRLVGSDALPDRQRWTIEAARLLKEGFLRQNGLHAVDAFCAPERQVRLLALFVDLAAAGARALEAGVPLTRLREQLRELPLTTAKELADDDGREIAALRDDVEAILRALLHDARGGAT